MFVYVCMCAFVCICLRMRMYVCLFTFLYNPSHHFLYERICGLTDESEVMNDKLSATPTTIHAATTTTTVTTHIQTTTITQGLKYCFNKDGGKLISAKVGNGVLVFSLVAMKMAFI